MIKKVLSLGIFFLSMSLGAMDFDKKLIIDAATAGLVAGMVLTLIDAINKEQGQACEICTLVNTNDGEVDHLHGIKPEVCNFCPIL